MRKCVLKVAEYHRAGTWIYLMLYAGLRPGEAAALTWNNVDLKNRILNVEQNVKRDRTVGSPKTKNGYRKIPISENLYNHLVKIKHGPFDYVCTNTKGGRLNSTSMQRMWDYFKNEMNIAMGCKTRKGRALPPYWVADDLVPYCFRHTFCTDLQDAGVPINVAKDLMG
ncbi:MAG: site-specific integrase [Anaerovoracaceae bacterium]